MRASILAAVVAVAVGLIAAGALLGARVGASGAAPEATPLAATEREQAEVDLGQEALGLLPASVTVSAAQSTAERRCLANGSYEPCAEFSVEAFGAPVDRRRPYEERARANGWRVVGFTVESDGATLALARGSIEARITMTTYGYDRVRVSDPAKRRPIAEPVSASPASEAATRAQFVTAAERACARLKATIAKRPPAGESRRETFARVVDAFEGFVVHVGGLRVPQGDERAVRALRTELRNYTRVLRMLQKVEGEEALTAAAAMVVQGNRAEAAMRQYGLRACEGITGVPKL